MVGFCCHRPIEVSPANCFFCIRPLSLFHSLASYPLTRPGDPSESQTKGDDMTRLLGDAVARSFWPRIMMIFLLVLLVGRAHADTAAFSIDPQDLDGAFKAFAVQSHREIFFAPELARGRKSQGVRGNFDVRKALDM